MPTSDATSTKHVGHRVEITLRDSVKGDRPVVKEFRRAYDVMVQVAHGGKFDSWIYHDARHPVLGNSFQLSEIRAIGAALTVCSTDLLNVIDTLKAGTVTIHKVWLPPSLETSLRGALSERGLTASFDDTSERSEPCLGEFYGLEKLQDLERHYSAVPAPQSRRSSGKKPSGIANGLKRAYVGQKVVLDEGKGRVVGIQGVTVTVEWYDRKEPVIYSLTKDPTSWVRLGKCMVW